MAGIIARWLACYTAEEIGEAVGLERRHVDEQLVAILADVLKSPQVQFSDDVQPPIYNEWHDRQSMRVIKVDIIRFDIIGLQRVA